MITASFQQFGSLVKYLDNVVEKFNGLVSLYCTPTTKNHASSRGLMKNTDQSGDFVLKNMQE